MTTWKLTIKPNSKQGFNSFDLCKKKSLLGIGWSDAYENEQASNRDEARSLVEKRYNTWPYAVRKLLDEVNQGDHVWLHQQGHYYLCRASNDIVLGSAIDKEFMSYDLGHARRADWVKVPEIFVSGSIQRGTIARKMIQKIRLTPQERNYHNILFNKISNDSNWSPKVDTNLLSHHVSTIGMHDLFAMMTPDDVEDVISLYLQCNSWFLIKSTCYRSKPTFEFSMLNEKAETCVVQVKSGKSPDPLPPSKYEKHVEKNKLIFLFSTNKSAYPGKAVDGVKCIPHEDIYLWVKDNCWSLTEPLKQRLWIYLCEKE